MTPCLWKEQTMNCLSYVIGGSVGQVTVNFPGRGESSHAYIAIYLDSLVWHIR